MLVNVTLPSQPFATMIETLFAATRSETTFSNAALFAALRMFSAYPAWRIDWLIVKGRLKYYYGVAGFELKIGFMA